MTHETRVLVCNLAALTAEQRARHIAASHRLLNAAKREDLADGFVFTIDRSELPAAELAEWVADEARCCPGLDFHLELPARGLLTLRIDGGSDVKRFVAAELGIDVKPSGSPRR